MLKLENKAQNVTINVLNMFAQLSRDRENIKSSKVNFFTNKKYNVWGEKHTLIRSNSRLNMAEERNLNA